MQMFRRFILSADIDAVQTLHTLNLQCNWLRYVSLTGHEDL